MSPPEGPPRRCTPPVAARRAARMALSLAAGVAAVCVALPVAPAAAAGGPSPHAAGASDWTTFDQNPMRTGVDASGTSFSPASPAWTSPALDGHLYGQPLVDAGRVFVATENDTVYALAADDGHVLWSAHVGTPVTASDLGCGDISPTVGITSTPVVDPARSEIFVVADEAAPSVAAHHLVGLDVYTGAVLYDRVIDYPFTDPAAQLQRVSLALDAGDVVVGFGGNSGDCGDYRGIVASVPESGSGPIGYFVVASQPGDGQGAVWMGGAAPVVDPTGDIWISTGNSSFTSSGDPYDDSDGVLRLSPALQVLDYFAPSHWYSDNASDADLGSTAPSLVGGLVFQVGKAETAYVLD